MCMHVTLCQTLVYVSLVNKRHTVYLDELERVYFTDSVNFIMFASSYIVLRLVCMNGRFQYCCLLTVS